MAVHNAFQSTAEDDDSLSNSFRDTQHIRNTSYSNHNKNGKDGSDVDDDDSLGSASSDDEEEYIPKQGKHKDDDDDILNQDEFEDKAVNCFRFFVLSIMIGGMLAGGILVYGYNAGLEQAMFEEEFELITHSFNDGIQNNVKQALSESRDFATTITALSKRGGGGGGVNNNSNQNLPVWPFFTDESFHVIGSNFRNTSWSEYVAVAPLIQASQQQMEEWGDYSTSPINQQWIIDGLLWGNKNEGLPLPPLDELEPIHHEIFSIVNGEAIPRIPHNTSSLAAGDDDVNPLLYLAPLWQMSPVPFNPSMVVNFDILSNPTIARIFETVHTFHEPVLSQRINMKELFLGIGKEDDEEATISTALLLHPLTADFDNKNIVALTISLFDWENFFVVEDHHNNPAILAVIRDGCGEEFTMELSSNYTSLISLEDSHDDEFDDFEVSFQFAPFLRTDHGNSSEGGISDHDGERDSASCAYIISYYPTEEFYAAYMSKTPIHKSITLVCIIVISTLLFCLYDCAVHYRQRKILAIAAQSERILSILYPKTIRDRLFGAPETQATIENSSEHLGRKTPDSSDRRRRSSFTLPGKGEGPKAAKYQLKSFIAHGDTSHRSKYENLDDMVDINSKPIADLFPHATVMFADIAGFTAWSSVREPSQVFALLEAVYAAFDEMAKRRRVFKVETVGDCYVAVTGLPEPRDDHALAMCRFARNCVERFKVLAGKLETTLGPDTGDLGIRVGIHSGPVTAGVLRGDKSRFQLFGDTVNTAARIEAGGRRNKIHLSTETAELIKNAGKSHWLRRRDREIEAKGKGKLQTFWLLPKDEAKNGSGGGTGSSGSTRSETDAQDETTVHEMEDFEDPLPIPQEISQKMLNFKATSAEEIMASLSPKVSRLVHWNVDVLSRLLKRIIAKRNASGSWRSFDAQLTRAESELTNKFLILDEVVEIIPLPAFDQNVHKRQEDANTIELPKAVTDQLVLYVACIAAYHKDNAFHNFEHASHVMMSVSKLLSRIVAADDIADENGDGSALCAHDHTYGITSDPMTHFSVVLSALIHDVDHGGVSNFQLIKENHKLAELFKGKSIAEQNSIVLAWDTLMEPRFRDFRRCIYADLNELQRFRQLITNTVLATDIFDKELGALRKRRWETAFSLRTVDKVSERDDVNRKATIVIEHLIQASDVAHTMQHWHIYRKWNERLFQEMTNAFVAGRMEKNPADFWYEGELSFFDNYIIPLAKKLQDCGVFGVSSDEYLNYALENRREWSSKGAEVTAALARKYQSEGDDDDTMNGSILM